MIKLPVRVNILASLPVAPTLPSLAYENSGTKQAPHPLQARPVAASLQDRGTSGGAAGPTEVLLPDPQPLLHPGGHTLSGLHPFPKGSCSSEWGRRALDQSGPGRSGAEALTAGPWEMPAHWLPTVATTKALQGQGQTAHSCLWGIKEETWEWETCDRPVHVPENGPVV